MNALADAKMADYLKEHFIATYLKVGTFRIVNGQKQGGNVASYFCRSDGAVIHAVAGPVNARTLLREARWALEMRKAALTFATQLATGEVDSERYAAHIRKAHEERLRVEHRVRWANLPEVNGNPPADQFPVPQGVSRPVQVHWLLAHFALAPIDDIYPIVWQQVLREKLSSLPVAQCLTLRWRASGLLAARLLGSSRAAALCLWVCGSRTETGTGGGTPWGSADS